MERAQVVGLCRGKVGLSGTPVPTLLVMTPLYSKARPA
jgi:hypothetical protein